MKGLFRLLPLLLLFILNNYLIAQDEVENTDWINSDQRDSLQAARLLNHALKIYRDDPDFAAEIIDKAFSIANEIHNPYLQSKSYSLKGVTLKNRGEYAAALSNHFKSLSINDSLGLKNAMATNYNDIGIIYKTMEEFDKALESYLKANSLTVELGMSRGIVMTLNNIGTIYEAKNDNDNAIAYYNMAMEKAEEYDILNGQAIALNNLGEIYAQRGDSRKAQEYFRKTLEIDRKTNDNIGSVYSILNIAGTFIGQKQFDSAYIYYTESESLAKELNAKQLLIHVYLGLTELFQQKNDFKNAFNYQKLANAYQDSLYNETRSKQLAEVEAKYNTLKKDKEIQELKQEQLIKNIQIEQHKAERIAWLSLFILGVLIIWYLYKRYKLRQNEIFSKQLLKQKETHLRAVVEAQEEERKRIAKDLHDGVGQTLSGIRLSMQNMTDQLIKASDPNGNKLHDLTTLVDDACSEVRSISHQMMPRILQEEGLIPALADMLNKSFNLSPIKYNFEHYGITERYKEHVEIGLFRIAQELINNIIKHSDANEVNVQLFQTNKTLVLLIEDNGKGFDVNKIQSKGIGLMNINSRVETIHGEFNLEPSPQSGTLATIRIPIEKK